MHARALVLAVLELLRLTAASPLLVPFFKSSMRPCPKTAPVDVDVDQLLGVWHLSLLLLDSEAEAYPFFEPDMELESQGDALLSGAPTCAAVEVLRTNASELLLDWSLHQLGVPGGLADLRLQVPAVVSSQPGVWALSTPLEGEMLSTIRLAAPRSSLVLSVCGDRGGSPVHLLTAVLTRKTPSSLGALELLRLSRVVMDRESVWSGGLLQRRREQQRLLSWSEC